MKKNHSIKITIIIALIYGAIFLLSEYTYRQYFTIPSIRNLFEAYAINLSFIFFMLFAKYRPTKFIIWAFFTLSIIANNIHYEVYRSWINSTNYLLSFIEVDEVTTAGSSMINKLFIPFIWGIIESIIFASLTLIKPRKSYKIADILFLALLIFICIRSFYSTQQHGISPNPDYSRLKANYFTIGHFLGKILPYKIGNLSDIEYYSVDEPNIISQPKVKNIILVVGESQNTKNMGVFGYERDTTPFFSDIKNKDYAIIKQGFSGALMTAVALPTLFNAIEQPNGTIQISKGNSNLFNLAKKQGYSTQFYTAQAERQMMIMNIIGLRWIDKMVFPTSLGYNKSENISDTQLLTYLKELNLDTEIPNFIVLHQRGSHVPYGSLLNEEDLVFGTKTIVDKYDNTIHKTDQLLESIYNHLQNRKKDDWILIFTSDHGQNVSNETFNHGGFTPSSYSVPMFIYSPDSQIQAEIRTQFEQCEYLFHQQISTLIISLMGYNHSISDCKVGYINGNLLSGDSGFLKINQETGEIKKIFATRE